MRRPQRARVKSCGHLAVIVQREQRCLQEGTRQPTPQIRNCTSYLALNSQGSLREVRVRNIRINYRFAVLHRIPQFAPRIQSTLQRTDSAYPLFSQEQRHTGAGSFVGSSTVENHFAVARQPIVFLFQFLGIHSERAGNRFGVRFKIQGVP